MISDQFMTIENKKVDTIDILNLSVTLQASVGNVLIKPITTISKIVVTIQQFFLIFGNLFILHHV